MNNQTLSKRCNWSFGNRLSDPWMTQCGKMYNTTFPSDRFIFCPFCGKTIKVVEDE